MKKGGAKVLDLVNQPLSFFKVSLRVKQMMNSNKYLEQENRGSKNTSRKLKRNTAKGVYLFSFLAMIVGFMSSLWVALFIQPVAIVSIYYIYVFRARKMYQINAFPVAYAIGISLHILLSLLLFVWLVTSSF